MGSPVHAAIQCALRSARALAYVDALYRRGSTTIPIRPTKSTEEVELIAGDGTVTVAKIILWRIVADELVVNGQEVEPAEGDLIEQQVGAKKETYEVQTAGGQACFQPIGPGCCGFLVRSRLVKSE